ncbi:MAG TPA: branched chain amino acid aminotransferase [Cryomorphaceae bacterium]|nr:branched chain amino acid aminotransferase [Cryomorphaceae bacterium]|tara:strand:+ start:578 stop:1639 length:1062 start_codon:yes stop_codon:yes gene_type:complete
MKIELTKQSRRSSIDFSNLQFGKHMSDHMLVCHFKNGQWLEPEIRPYGQLDFSYGLHALHYGQSAFEGMKAYRKDDGAISMFRPLDNFARLNKSAERLMMPQIPEEVFMGGLKKLLEIDEEWVPNADDHSLYIRPFLFASSEFIAARQSDDYTFCIITCPVGPYYSGSVKVKIEQEYTRATGGGIGFTKAAGNYGGSFYPTAQAIKEGYNQVIWTDHKEHKYIEESGTMNLMLLIDGTFLTPPLTDRILAGVTRRSIIQLVKDQGWPIEERAISVEEIVSAARDGRLQEAFGMGTAAVVSQIDTIGYNGQNFSIPVLSDGKAVEIKRLLSDIRLGRSEDSYGWMMNLSVTEIA